MDIKDTHLEPGNSRFKIFFLRHYFHKSNSKDNREFMPDPKMMFLRRVLQSGQSQDDMVQIHAREICQATVHGVAKSQT